MGGWLSGPRWNRNSSTESVGNAIATCTGTDSRSQGSIRRRPTAASRRSIGRHTAASARQGEMLRAHADRVALGHRTRRSHERTGAARTSRRQRLAGRSGGGRHRRVERHRPGDRARAARARVAGGGVVALARSVSRPWPTSWTAWPWPATWATTTRCSGWWPTAVEWGGKLTVMVNNAGLGAFGLLHEIDPERSAEMMIRTNVLGVIYGMRAAGEQLVRQRSGGGIVNISSIVGEFPDPGGGAYAASKAAVDLLSRTGVPRAARPRHPRGQREAGADRHRVLGHRPRRAAADGRRSAREGGALGCRSIGVGIGEYRVQVGFTRCLPQAPAPPCFPGRTTMQANRLLADDPNALLIGFVLDQQVTVQKAFAGPLVLKQRLGHLDPARIAAMPPERPGRGVPREARHPPLPGRDGRACAVAVRATWPSSYGGDGSRVWTRGHQRPGPGQADRLAARLRRHEGAQPGCNPDQAVRRQTAMDGSRCCPAIPRSATPTPPRPWPSYQAAKREHKRQVRAQRERKD